MPPVCATAWRSGLKSGRDYASQIERAWGESKKRQHTYPDSQSLVHELAGKNGDCFALKGWCLESWSQLHTGNESRWNGRTDSAPTPVNVPVARAGRKVTTGKRNAQRETGTDPANTA
jgi:hypothetical protein